MEDDLFRHSKTSSRLRNATPHKGHVYASAHKKNHNLRTSSEIATSSYSNFEGDQCAPYLMDNHQRRPKANQAMPNKLESSKQSPSIIARLMGLKEFPPEKELVKANKKSGGANHKPSLSGLLNNRNVEFKDVFEVIEERDRQQDTRQNMKGLMKVEESETDFENYRDSFLKNIEKSNSLLGKHLLELKCYPPHLHKGTVSRLKSGYDHEHVSTKNQKSRNLDQRNTCINHDHIVVISPNMGNIDEDPEFERTVHPNFLQNLQNRRSKMWTFETFEHQGGEHCNRSILKLQKLRTSDSNSSNEGTKSLAEVLATPDRERFEKGFDSHKYHRKNIKSKIAREGYYEKVDGSFAKLQQDISPVGLKSGLLEREDLIKLRARKHKLRENFTIKGKFSSRHDLTGVSVSDFETEEKMLYTIDEGQHAGPTAIRNFAKKAKKLGNEKRVSTEEKDECFSVLNFHRNTDSTEAEIPSPISVLEPTPTETASSNSSFWKTESDHHETDTQITEELEVCISSDDDGQGTTYNNKTWTLNLLRDQEEREYSYLLEMLIESGVHKIGPGTAPQRRPHSREFPVDPRLFDRLEKRYSKMLSWSKSDRRLLFDLVNSVLANVLAPFLDAHPWVRCDRHVGCSWGPEELVERVWLVLSREREKAMMGSEEEQMLDLNIFKNSGDDINVVGKQIERMLTDEMLEEIISGLLSYS